jgi:hypothetical protein
MTGQAYSLLPFPGPNIPAISLTGSASVENQRLALCYRLAGNVEDILLPSPSHLPRRRDELWKATCFELFVAGKGAPPYWEFNLSPSGDWNVYRMEAYRRIGFREEAAIESLPFVFQREADGFSLQASVDLRPILSPGQDLEIGLTAVIQTNDGNETYWALAHPGLEADFHLRDGFILTLAAQTHLSGSPALDG